MIFIVFVKYSITRFNISNCPYVTSWQSYWTDQRKIRYNRAALAIGLIFSVALTGVVSFQYSNAPWAHMVFASIYFIGGMVYICLQTILDLNVHANPGRVMTIRVIICALCILFFLPYFILQFFTSAINQDMSALFEILCAVTQFIYFVSYYYEFDQFKMKIDFHYSQPERQNLL
ncbi:hypothetical protein SAMD00019534_066940 [Acytostelium subglobosum LB1]|uniref:hypothetical protein n=1 Tax=Acytostelium subglobosum LB1 TaxID=1410327 RepID=UPI0006448DC2|nr:hypothetical protein SAMD00019534_066940 [Acytostelium subglobosum LB1]GAM23519.1 hypothetical protein SAMD00019534_066940 [Acytostelium subglobosum LB1]|eukprot:XP_012753260.1 hypothetical protein SAMD00019534_066940 [Acytostelium subglobosum LB1]